MCLLFVAAVAFPLGTNMPCEQRIVLPRQHKGFVHNVIPDANQAWILYSDGPERGSSRGGKFTISHVDFSHQDEPIRQTIVVADPGLDEGVYYSVRDLMWSEKYAQLAYVLWEKTQIIEGSKDRQRTLALCTIALDHSQANPILHRISLDDEMGEDLYTQACLFQQRIYVYDYRRMLVYSLEESQTPVLLYSEQIDSTGPANRHGVLPSGSGHNNIKLLPVSQLSDQGRLVVTQQFTGYAWHLLGNQQVVLDQRFRRSRDVGLTLYKIDTVKDGIAMLSEQGRHRVRPIDTLLYLILRPSEILANNEYAFCNSTWGVTVYDIADPNHIQRLGHYAAGEDFVCMAPLARDRIIIGGENLHVLKLPDAGK